MGTSGIFLWGLTDFFCCMFLTALRVALQLGVAQILLNLSRVLSTEGSCLLTAYSPHNHARSITFTRKGKLLPINTRSPCKTKHSQEQVLPEEVVAPSLRAAPV